MIQKYQHHGPVLTDFLRLLLGLSSGTFMLGGFQKQLVFVIAFREKNPTTQSCCWPKLEVLKQRFLANIGKVVLDDC